MRALQIVAHSGITVVAVVHQPRYDIYQMFDDVLLLGKGGRTVYMGPSAQTLSYFEALGYSCPQHVNPPDFFLDIMTDTFNSSKNITTGVNGGDNNEDSVAKYGNCDDNSTSFTEEGGPQMTCSKSPPKLCTPETRASACLDLFAAWVAHAPPSTPSYNHRTTSSMAPVPLASIQHSSSIPTSILPILQAATTTERKDHLVTTKTVFEPLLSQAMTSFHFWQGFLLGFLTLGLGVMIVELVFPCGHLPQRPSLSSKPSATPCSKSSSTSHVDPSPLHSSSSISVSPSYIRQFASIFGVWLAVALGSLGYDISTLVIILSISRIDAPSQAFMITLLLFAVLSFVFLFIVVRRFRAAHDLTFFVYFTIGFANIGPLGLIYVFVIRQMTCSRSRLAVLFGFGTQLLVVGITLVFTFYILWIGSSFSDTRCSPEFCHFWVMMGVAFVFLELVIAVVFASRYKRLPSHDRATMGMIGQLWLCARRGFVQQTRDVAGSMFELGLVSVSGLFLGLIFYKRPYFGPATEDKQRLCPKELQPLCALPLQDPVISEASLICLALSLAAVTSGQRIFGREKAMFMRESGSGLGTEAYYLGKSLAHLPFSLLSPLLLLALFYPLSDLRGDFLQYYILLILVHMNATGIAYFMSITFSDTVAQLAGVLAVLVCMMFGGANPTLKQLQDGVLGGALYYPTLGSFIRWSQENFYLIEMEVFARSANVDESMLTYSYSFEDKTQTWVVLCVYIMVVRVLSYLACVLHEP